MAGFIQSMGLPLVDAGNKPFDSKQLAPSTVVALYFSAHWCPPCRQFTPLLKKFVETLQAAGDESLKVIFVSRDHSEMDMWKYMHEAHGNWLAIPYAGDQRDKLCHKFGIQGIPALLILNQVGQPAVPAQNTISQVHSAANFSAQVLSTYMSWRDASGAAAASPSWQAGGQDRCSELPAGARVRIRGLTGAPEHNGMEGTIGGYDAARERYVVKLGEKSLALRASSLLQILSVWIRLAEEDEERCEAVLMDVNEDSGELVVQPEREGAESVCARLEDHRRLVLKEGARVAVHGLQAESARQWNEHLGKILEFDEAAGRYKVEVAPGSQLKIRPDNMRVCPLC